MTIVRPLIGFVCLALAGAACGSVRGTTDTQPPTSATFPAVTAPATTPPSTTSTASTSSLVTYEPDGSGCAPGAGDLPDGTWFGLVASSDENAIEFDLACWFSGDDAELAAAEDGGEAPNGYFVRNTDLAVRLVAVDEEAVVTWYPNAGDPQSEETVQFATWVSESAKRGPVLGVWIDIRDGIVDEIREQWVP